MGMETEKKFFVYVDYRKDDGKPFYVGKGTGDRVKLEKRNPLHTNIVNKHGIIREIFFETYSEQDAFEKEIQLIQELKTYIDFGEGGANLTLGGEGSSGHKLSEEQKRKLSETSKKQWEDPEARKRISELNKKTWEDPELRTKVSKIHKKRWEDPETKKKLSESIKKKWEDPEYRDKTIKAIISPESREKLKKMWENHEHRENIAESMKKIWENPEHKEKVSKLIKDHHSDPEFKKKQGEKMREVLSDPEIREKISRITKEKLSDPEIRKKIGEKVKLSAEKLTPEQRSENTRKGWETRRLKKLQQEA